LKKVLAEDKNERIKRTVTIPIHHLQKKKHEKLAFKAEAVQSF
jgi:hypothetical protein